MESLAALRMGNGDKMREAAGENTTQSRTITLSSCRKVRMDKWHSCAGLSNSKRAAPFAVFLVSCRDSIPGVSGCRTHFCAVNRRINLALSAGEERSLQRRFEGWRRRLCGIKFFHAKNKTTASASIEMLATVICTWECANEP